MARERNGTVEIRRTEPRRRCPQCHEEARPRDARYCPRDGEALVDRDGKPTAERLVYIVACSCDPAREYPLDEVKFCPRCGTGFAKALHEDHGILTGHHGL